MSPRKILVEKAKAQRIESETKFDLVDSLRASTALLEEYISFTGSCDHTVNVCSCGLKSQVETNKALIKKITGQD